jgi:hypothetical protein
VFPRRRANGRPDPRRRYRNNKKEKKEVCIRKPPSWLSRLDAGAAKRVGLAPDFRRGGLQARVGRVDVAPIDFAPRPAQFATESAVETFGLLDIALDGADFAARGANVFEVTTELFKQTIEMAQLFFDVADVRMTTVKLMRDFFGETVDLCCLFVNVANAYTHSPTPSWLKEPAPIDFYYFQQQRIWKIFTFRVFWIVKVN